MNENNPLMNGNVSSAVFFPRPDMPYGEEAAGAKDHMFEVESGVRLRLRLFMGEKHWPVVLFFHGNGETGRDYDGLVSSYHKIPVSFAVGEYRGYGPSTGEPSLETILPDAHITLDELMVLLAKEGHTGPIIVMGRSLGSAPAIDLAASRSSDLNGLIVESGFAYIVPLLELMGVPVQQLDIREEHGPMSLEKMAAVNLPTLIMHAQGDQIIPIEDAESLNKAAKDPDKVFFRVPGAGHNDIQYRAGRAYFEQVGKLVERAIKP